MTTKASKQVFATSATDQESISAEWRIVKILSVQNMEMWKNSAVVNVIRTTISDSL
ncbi:MAG: hypothetical protein QF475_03620 [Candidatus Undinarchaeales archaeon]|nr:hypothetical protein [Candidatus Undinarchaeales archaeon]